ncbi:MAG TPA: beta-ketoacyl-ACP synthase II [Phycisphaerae bacterium]|nr:beta-ketoacyl-ACP synthase II [Phycisphaerae bacterium]
MARRVVVTGLGLVTSLGQRVEEFWRRLLAGESGISAIERFDASAFSVRIAGEVKDFDPAATLDKREARHLDRFAQMAVAAADQAVKDSGLDLVNLPDPFRAGAIVGSGIGGLAEFEEQHRRLLEKGPSRVSPFMVPKLMINAAAGQISIRYAIKGPNAGIANACASANNAIGQALWTIQSDEADLMIAGGSEAALTPLGLAGFCSARALSTRNDEPARASRPFDRGRDGFVLSEGAGIIVLEEYEHAKRRGARVYAEVIGFGMSGDGLHIVQPDPEGRGAAGAMRAMLQDAQAAPDSVDYINAHGTATPLGDIAETKALKAVFGAHARKLAISSTKSSVGHLLGASGGVEFIATALAIRDQVAPPTINLEDPDPECDLDYVPLKPRPMTIRRAASNSFGFGGHNACLLLQKS